MNKLLIVLLFISLLGCQSFIYHLDENEVYSSDQRIFSYSISPDENKVFIRKEYGFKIIGLKGKEILLESETEYEDAIWSPQNDKFLGYRPNESYHYIDLTHKIVALEENLWPTVWTKDGSGFYAYMEDRLYELSAPSLEKKEIVVDEPFSVGAKKVLYETKEKLKIILYEDHTILILNQENKLIDIIEEIDYTHGIYEETIRLSNDETKLSFYREAAERISADTYKSELWVYDLTLKEEKKLCLVKGYNVLWAPTNERLLVYKSFPASLQLVDLNAKKVTLLEESRSDTVKAASWIEGTDQVALVVLKRFLLFGNEVYIAFDTQKGKIEYEKDLPHIGNTDIYFSNDGMELFYTPIEEEGILRIIKATLHEK
jgi:hypothetical protein